MQRGLWLLVLGVLAAALGVASARAAGTGTTPTGTTTTVTTTTGTTTTTPSYAALSLFSLPNGCVGGGAAAVLPPAHPPIALGTPGASLGPSAYGSVLAFASSAESGWGCKSTRVTVESVSLFDGAVTASSVQSMAGRGSVMGLAIGGTPASVEAGQSLHVADWGQLTFGATVGRVTAPLVLRLLRAHGSLPAGTSVVVAFAAVPRPVAKPKPQGQAGGGRQRQQDGKLSLTHDGKQHGGQQGKAPPDFPALPYPVLVKGDLSPAAQHNPVVSTAMQYLGVRYTWGGASPKTGFDCSGLVMFVFGKLGLSLPHYAASQYYSPDSIYVSPKRLQPGDLVFFVGSDGTRKEPGHVGIYVGDGYLIDAPHTGSFVRIDSLNERSFANGFVGARRIVGPLHNARHLFHVHAQGAFLPQISFDPLGEKFALAAAVTDPSVPAWHGHWTIAVAGGLLVLLTAGGLVGYRRRVPSRQGSLDFRQPMR